MNTKLLFVTFTLIVVPVILIRADGQTYNTPSMRMVPSPSPKFNSSTVEGQVAEIMERSKSGDLALEDIIYLMGKHKDDPNKVLFYVDKYVNDPSEDVKFAVIDMAAQANTKKAMEILRIMSLDRDVTDDAVKTIYSKYNRQKIVVEGGMKLKTALIRALLINRYSSHAPLLLSIFGRKKATINLLKRRLASYTGDEHEDQIISVNLALANMGDSTAKNAVFGYFSRNDVRKLTIVLSYLKFLQEKSVLSQVVSLLRHKTNAQNIAVEGAPPLYIRVCDEAMLALQRKFDSPTPPYYERPHRFTDAELLAAYNKYSALLADKADATSDRRSQPAPVRAPQPAKGTSPLTR